MPRRIWSEMSAQSEFEVCKGIFISFDIYNVPQSSGSFKQMPIISQFTATMRRQLPSLRIRDAFVASVVVTRRVCRTQISCLLLSLAEATWAR